MEPFLSMIHMGEEREKTLPDPGFGAFCLPSNTAVSTPRGPGSSRCKPVEADKPPSSDDVAGSGIDADSTMHYGEEKSRNDFADEPAGYVYGCMDPGDEIMFDTLADLGQMRRPRPPRTATARSTGPPAVTSDAPTLTPPPRCSRASGRITSPRPPVGTLVTPIIPTVEPSCTSTRTPHLRSSSTSKRRASNGSDRPPGRDHRHARRATPRNDTGARRRRRVLERARPRHARPARGPRARRSGSGR